MDGGADQDALQRLDDLLAEQQQRVAALEKDVSDKKQRLQNLFGEVSLTQTTLLSLYEQLSHAKALVLSTQQHAAFVRDRAQAHSMFSQESQEPQEPHADRREQNHLEQEIRLEQQQQPPQEPLNDSLDDLLDYGDSDTDERPPPIASRLGPSVQEKDAVENVEASRKRPRSDPPSPTSRSPTAQNVPNPELERKPLPPQSIERDRHLSGRNKFPQRRYSTPFVEPICIQHNISKTGCIEPYCKRRHVCLVCHSRSHHFNACPLQLPNNHAKTLCFSYNAVPDKGCFTGTRCNRMHRCLRCDGDHKSLNCPQNESVENGSRR